eukprot:5118060-Prymnesium_polylepis.1
MVMRSTEEKVCWKETRSAAGGRVVASRPIRGGSMPEAQLSPRSTNGSVTHSHRTPSQKRGAPSVAARTTALARPRPSRP